MKKTIAVLLLAVAGAGIYYALQYQKKKTSSNTFDQQLIVGTWKLDSIAVPVNSKENDLFTGIMGMIDPDLLNYHYSFNNDKTITLTLRDSVIQDSARYEWLATDSLIWKETPKDNGTKFRLQTLNKDTLRLREGDSTQMIFHRINNKE